MRGTAFPWIAFQAATRLAGPRADTSQEELLETGPVSPLFPLTSSTISQKPLHLFCPVASAGVGFFSYKNVSVESGVFV